MSLPKPSVMSDLMLFLDPIYYLPLDGDALDYAGNGHNGSNTGVSFVTGLLNSYSWESGQAGDFNGGDRIQISTSPQVGLAGATFIAWIRTDNNTNRTWLNNESDGYMFYWRNSTNNLQIQMPIGGATRTITSPLSNFPNGQTYMLAIRWDASDGQYKLFKNGTVMASSTQSHATLSGFGSDWTRVGEDRNGGNDFDGRIQHHTLIGRGLSDDEIADIYSAVTTGVYPDWYEAPAQSAYDEIVLADGPKIYLPLDDETGPAAHSLAGQHGTYGGGVTLGVDGPSAVGSDGISTDGVNDYCAVGTTSGFGINQRQSWEFWLKNDSTINSSAGPGYVFRADDGNSNYGIGFGPLTGQLTNEVATVLTRHDTAPSNFDASGWDGVTISPGWHHHVFTYDGTQGGWIWYLDGVSQGMPDDSGNAGHAEGIDNGLTLEIARNGVGSYYALDGLAAFATYDYTLSPAQVSQHYSVTPPPFESVASFIAEKAGAVLHLPLDDHGGTVADAVIGSDGAFSGNPTFRVSGPSSLLAYGISTDGTNDQVTYSMSNPGASSPQSYEIWFNSSSTINSSGNWRLIGNSGTAANAALHFGSVTGELSNEVLTVFGEGGTAGRRTAWSGFTVPAGWHHLTVTYSGEQNGWTAYIDGENIEGPSWGATKIINNGGSVGFSATNFSLGQDGTGGVYTAWDGLAAYSVYDRELTESEVNAHYLIGNSLWATSHSPVVV